VNTATKNADTIQYGFKRISPANLLKEDNHPAYPSGPTHEHWVQACLKPQLESTVPEEIAFLFEVARGSMAYGRFFLPLASLAIEQTYRVLEAAARYRCKQLCLLKPKPGKAKALPVISFAEVVAALQKAGRIPPADLDAWSTIPFSRNRCSHPTSQTILSRRSAAALLAYNCQLLNRLFQ
jgi:hypothetical protein